MAAPTSWENNGALQAFMIDALGTVAQALGWGVSSVLEAANDLLLDMGYTDVTEIPTARIRESRALARVYAWKKAVPALAGLHSFSADQQRYDLSDVQKMANVALQQAITDYMEFDPSYSVGTVAVIHKNDPYVYLPDSERTVD